MEISRPYPPPRAKRPWKGLVAVILGVAALVLAVTVPTVLLLSAECSTGARNASEGLALLEKALDVTNRSLVEARGQWDSCRVELGVLQGKAWELEQALANLTRLEEENRELRTELSRQQEQLKEEQSSREELYLQNQLLQDQLWDMRRQRSAGIQLQALSLSLLALLLLLLGMLLL